MAQARRYLYTMPRYAKTYAVPEATVRKWAQAGHHLDNPKLLLADLLKQKSPRRADLSGVRELAHLTRLPALNPRKPVDEAPRVHRESVTKVVPGYEDEESDDAADEITTSASEATDPGDKALVGFQRELKRLEVEADRAYKAYERADDAAIKRELWQTWKSMLDALGKLAKIAPTAEKEAGLLMRATDVEAAWSRTFSEMKVELEALPRRVSTRPELRAVDPVTIEQTIEAEIIKVMTIFQKGANANS